VVKVRGAGGGRVSIAGVVCYRPGSRPRLFCQLRVCHRRKGEPKGFSWIEGIWPLLKRAMASFAAAGLESLVRIVKRKLKKIQYRPHLIDGCLTPTGLTIEP
jgi:hypothetical protein